MSEIEQLKSENDVLRKEIEKLNIERAVLIEALRGIAPLMPQPQRRNIHDWTYGEPWGWRWGVGGTGTFIDSRGY